MGIIKITQNPLLQLGYYVHCTRVRPQEHPCHFHLRWTQNEVGDLYDHIFNTSES